LSDKDLALILLNNSIGQDIKDIILSSEMEMLQPLRSGDYYKVKAQENNGSLKLLESKKQMLKQKYKSAVGNFLPNIALVGQYQMLQDDLTFIEPK
jgi:outer membrane protein TolC